MNKTIILGTTLETERLILRLPMECDLDGWSEMMGHEEASRFIGGVLSRPECWRQLSATVGSWVLKGFGMFSVLEKESGNWIGRIGPMQPEGWPGTEIGYGLHQNYWGKGYAFEAACTCIDWAFDNLGWSEVIHCIEPANINSRKLAERLGSRKLRTTFMPPPLHGKPYDIWGQTREEWRARKNP